MIYKRKIGNIFLNDLKLTLLPLLKIIVKELGF
ncbi:hypothetical protein DFQ05_0570 [Winogradskyella wandonensis]|uniref:Uncharacterized protein n=1 Tax=Winogradskyella wandonensis TaxID=1442586 RepID=A0A4R1KXR6_9FLAO|nr:hypothetical protein DFQ05_0570 [Winogradskyella wandonensis]